MTEWILRSRSDRVLEPSFGDGSFLSALHSTASSRAWTEVEIAGVEIDERPFEQAISGGLISRENAFRDDFLSVSPFPVDAVVGNPPYVRLRHLPSDQRVRALRLTEDVLGVPMESSGSLWMPFVVHSSQFLRPGGRLALVLPYELTHVRYARPLWEYLSATFGSLTILRTRDRLFPEILQEAVVLLADAKGRTTRTVELRAFDNVRDLGADRPSAVSSVPLERVVAGDRVFQEALLPRPLQELLLDKARALTVPAGEVARFHIGYVSGDKRFFHPDAATVSDRGLPSQSLVPAVTSTRKLKGAGLRTSALTSDRRERLFLPDVSRGLSTAEAAYVALGEELGVDLRYKCAVRDPWFVVPSVEIPDVILSVFCELPLLMLNDAGFTASNSLLCGYMRGAEDATTFTTSWYTSLTALQCELQVHSLGGGVLVLVPRETGAVRVARPPDGSESGLTRVNGLLAAGRLEDAYAAGDDLVLRGNGFSTREIGLIAEGAGILRRWRSNRPS